MKKILIFCSIFLSSFSMALADGIDLAKTENAKKLETKRPKKADRLFVSEEVERCIADVKKQLTHP